MVQATLFNRVENDVLRPPDLARETRAGALCAIQRARVGIRTGSTEHREGVELVVGPSAVARLSGWVSYTYAIARQTDIGTRETFWSDVDRRHAFNTAGVVRIGHQSTAGIILRAASGVPLPGYFDLTNGRLFVGDHRNEIRLPPYVRLDVRVQRTLFSSRHAVTIFGEMLNVLNRQNQGIAEGILQPVTGEANGFTRPLLLRRASIGIQLDLSR